MLARHTILRTPKVVYIVSFLSKFERYLYLSIASKRIIRRRTTLISNENLVLLAIGQRNENDLQQLEGVNHILDYEVAKTVLPGQRPGYPGTYL